MARGPATFRQQDVTRALRATVTAGIEVSRVEIDKEGKIVIVTGKTMGNHDTTSNEWDEINDTHPS
jgi:hypothetical protein